MNNLPISVCLLSWKSNSSIRNTLKSYKKNGLLQLAAEKIVFFQEFREKDIRLAEKYDLKIITSETNIGIGKAFLKLAEKSTQPYILILEHDWELVEDKVTTHRHLCESILLLNEGFHSIRLRHRKKYGYPHYSINKYISGQELEYYDDWIDLHHPHLIDTIHWLSNPEKTWPDKINKINNFFHTTSRYANWTNNPCLYKKSFFIDSINRFTGTGIELEKQISYWWARQEYNVAQGEGLFCHNDLDKYSIQSKIKRLVSKLWT